MRMLQLKEVDLTWGTLWKSYGYLEHTWMMWGSLKWCFTLRIWLGTHLRWFYDVEMSFTYLMFDTFFSHNSCCWEFYDPIFDLEIPCFMEVPWPYIWTCSCFGDIFQGFLGIIWASFEHILLTSSPLEIIPHTFMRAFHLEERNVGYLLAWNFRKNTFLRRFLVLQNLDFFSKKTPLQPPIFPVKVLAEVLTNVP